MSHLAANQIRESTETLNYSLQQAQQSRQIGDTLTQAENASKSAALTTLYQLEKDIIVAADPNGGESSSSVSGGSQQPSRPKLQSPWRDWNGFQGVGSQEPGLAAILGEVLALQAKMSSNFYSILWQQASQSMMLEVKFAPIIGNAIELSYKDQSEATKAQASQAKADGMTNLISFAGSIVISVAMEPGDESQSANKKPPPPLYSREAENAENEMQRMGGQFNQETSQNLNGEDQAFSDRAQKGWDKVKNIQGTASKRLSSIFGRTLQTAQGMQMLSAGITGWFIDSHYLNVKAAYEGAQGEQQAVSEEGRQYAQFYGQDFSRNEDLRQGAGQNLDYAMNILKSAVDTITQTVTSMFRG